MSEPISTQCTECNAILKLKSSKNVGKKVSCPKCKQPFVVQVFSEPEDDGFDALNDLDSYEDDSFSEDEYGESALPPTTRKRKPSGKSKKPQSRGWKVPAMIAGGSVLAIALVVGAVMVFSGNGDEENDSSVAQKDDSEDNVADNSGAQNGGGGNKQKNSGGNVSTTESKFDLAYLSPNAELIARGNVSDVWNSQAVQAFVGNPLLKSQIDKELDKVEQQIGFRIGDVDTVTLGVAGISDELKKSFSGGGSEPNLEETDVVAVVRFNKPPDQSKLTSQTTAKQHEGKTYYVANGKAPLVVYVPDSKTYVIGTEAGVTAAIKRGSQSTPRPDLAFVNSNQDLVVAFLPRDLTMLRMLSQQPLPPDVPPAVVTFVIAASSNVSAVALGFSMTQGSSLQLQGKCETSNGAAKLKAAFDGLLVFGKQQLEENTRNVPPQAAPIVKMANDFMNLIAVKQTGELVSVNATLPQTDATAGQSAIMVALLLPAIQQAREAARRAQCKNNLRQIGLAMHNHHDAYKSFPPAAIKDKSGKPLLSWRVHILPFLDQQALYQQFHLDEPWDSEHNKSLIPRMPAMFTCPNASAETGKTSYLGVTGPGAIFDGDQGTKMRDITDGTSNTIMVVEADDAHAVIWTKPADYKFNPQKPAEGLPGHHTGGFHVLACDGAVRFISEFLQPETLKAMFTKNGGEQISGF